MSKRRFTQGITFDDDLIKGITFNETQENILRSVDSIRNVIMKDNNNPLIGKKDKNVHGSEMEIIGHYNNNHIIVLLSSQINDNPMYYINYNTRLSHFNDGNIRSPYEISIHDHGYIGDGKYYNAKYKKFAETHSGMIRRCHKDEIRSIQYNDVSIYQMWYDFQNFAEWCEYNYYEIEGEEMWIDKDLICKNSKIYSPVTCCFLPSSINLMFKPNSGGSKKSTLPRGFSYNPEMRSKPYRVQCNNFSDQAQVHLGYFSTIEEGFKIYKDYKENKIKRVADDYWFNRGGRYIPQFKRVYDAMYAYQVEIDD